MSCDLRAGGRLVVGLDRQLDVLADAHARDVRPAHAPAATPSTALPCGSSSPGFSDTSDLERERHLGDPHAVEVRRRTARR